MTQEEYDAKKKQLLEI
ncbi:MAG: hypothetical protein IJ281_03880 [Clostridia bacterium]|nr:hypothetical protein [Clostridia bacterium]